MARLASSPMKVKINIPLVLTLAVIPDVDLLSEPVLAHRGPLHSIIILIAVFTPFFITYRKVAIPYFLAVASHPLIGDYLGGGKLQLFWPLSKSYYGLNATPATIHALELILFLSSLLILAKTKDMYLLFQPSKFNALLVIPLVTVTAPLLFSLPLGVPLSLIPAHIAYGLLFFSSIAWTIAKFLHRDHPQPTRLMGRPDAD